MNLLEKKLTKRPLPTLRPRLAIILFALVLVYCLLFGANAQACCYVVGYDMWGHAGFGCSTQGECNYLASAYAGNPYFAGCGVYTINCACSDCFCITGYTLSGNTCVPTDSCYQNPTVCCYDPNSSGCSCTNGQTQACTTSDGCSGTQTCSSGQWGACQSKDPDCGIPNCPVGGDSGSEGNAGW